MVFFLCFYELVFARHALFLLFFMPLFYFSFSTASRKHATGFCFQKKITQTWFGVLVCHENNQHKKWQLACRMQHNTEFKGANSFNCSLESLRARSHWRRRTRLRCVFRAMRSSAKVSTASSNAARRTPRRQCERAWKAMRETKAKCHIAFAGLLTPGWATRHVMRQPPLWPVVWIS